ncbi:hypothetical protein SPAR_10152 [Streptomyces sparsogenes DSM 40356]|uniref:Uncharacterized protein n=2 Tax=Streptomyces sparsogenes TaxID=67365 RepID=A0A1R1SMM7_9ACTN|nr:hypothetical protein SPAR_10152 [Streptomyces sparsogenes DSM 40356]
MQTLYANLMGSVVVVWALLRIVKPQPAHGLFDGVARTLFSAWQAYALAHGATRLLWFFFAVEVSFGLVQLLPWWRARPRRLTGPSTAGSCRRSRSLPGIGRPS